MERTQKISYKGPHTQVFSVNTDSLICYSGNTGTELVGIISTEYDDSDFE